MVFYDFNITNICENLDWVEITRLLVVCKTLNSLVKKHVTSISTPYHSRYKDFTGLRDITYTSGVVVDLPPNIIDLRSMNNIKIESFPKSVKSICINGPINRRIPRNLVEFTSQRILENIQDISFPDSLYHLDIFTHEMPSLPSNLTILCVNMVCTIDLAWKELPRTLTDLNVSCSSSDVYMRDLPPSLKRLTYRTDIQSMKHNDYFNNRLEFLDTNIGETDRRPFGDSNLPISLTSLTFHASKFHAISSDIEVLVKQLPVELLHLSIRTNYIGRRFCENLPPNLLSLSLGTYKYSMIYTINASLLPRSLTELRYHDGHNYINIQDVSYLPPNIQCIDGVTINYSGTKYVDFSNFMSLHTLKFVLERQDMHVLLPSNLKTLHYNSNIVLPEGLTSYTCDGKLKLSDINKLPRSLKSLTIHTLIENNNMVVDFPPELTHLSIYNDQPSFKNLLRLPITLTSYKCYYRYPYALVRTIDGRRWE